MHRLTTATPVNAFAKPALVGVLLKKLASLFHRAVRLLTDVEAAILSTLEPLGVPRPNHAIIFQLLVLTTMTVSPAIALAQLASLGALLKLLAFVSLPAVPQMTAAENV